ncbi:MAG: flagellar motor protein MotB [Myxococcota bacterium]
MKRSAVEVAQSLLAYADGGEDPWLISYADLVTNLLAFMVLLVSLAGISFAAVERVPEVFASGRPQPLAELESEVADLARREGLAGRVAASVDADGLAIRLEDAILFPTGVAELTAEGNALVSKVGTLLRALPPRYRVVVEGHTDDVPISTLRFASNWHLSAARALEVRTTLAQGGVVDNRRLSISAFADTRPPEAQDAESLASRRQRARRVVIRVGL